MKNIFWVFILLPFLAFSQNTDTSFFEYEKYADSAYANDNLDLKAYTWYIKCILMAQEEDPDSAYIPRMARIYEVTANISYDYSLYDYSRIFHERALAFYRNQNDLDGIVRVIPKIALAYKAMRNNNEKVDPPEAEEYETAEVYYRIIDDPQQNDGTIQLLINGGVSDGLYKTSIGYVYATDKKPYEDRANVKLGNAKITQLDTNAAILEVVPVSNDTGFYQIYKGDMVMMLSLIPKREFKSILWKLAIDQVVFINMDTDPIYDYRQLLKYDSEILEDEILEIMKRDVLATWEWLRDLDEEEKAGFESLLVQKLERGRFKGLTVYEAMGKTTKADVKAFLGFVRSFPGKYMGIPYKINETYATWVLNGCLIGFEEFFEVFMRLKSDEDYQAFLEEYETEIIDDDFFTRINMRSEEESKNGNYLLGQTINNKVITLASFLEDKSFMGWAYFNKARISEYNENIPQDSLISDYEKGLIYFTESGDIKGKAYCLNNIGSIYEDLEKYTIALDYYKRANQTKLLLHDLRIEEPDIYYYSLAKSNSGIGNTEYLLSNYDSAIVAYKQGIGWCDSAESLEAMIYAVSLQTDLARVYNKRGQYGLASDLYADQVKRYLELGKPDKVADAYDNQADVLFSKGEYQQSFEKYYGAYEIKNSLEDWSGSGFSLSNCGQSMWNLGDLDSAISLHEKALEYRERAGDQKGMAYSVLKVATLYKELGEIENATVNYRKAYNYYLDAGDSLKVAEISLDIGEFFYDVKNYTRALEFYEYAEGMYEARGMKSEFAQSVAYRGGVYYELKDFAKTKELYAKALRIRREINERQNIMYSLVDYSIVLMINEYRFDTALVMLNEALELARETESKDYEAFCYHSIGNAYYFQAKSTLADQNYRKALSIYEETGDISNQCYMILNLGANEMLKGDFKTAKDYYQKSMDLARGSGLNLQIANTYNYLAEYYYYTGEFNESFSVLDSSYRIYAESENAYGLANTHILLGNTHNLIGNGTASLEQYAMADSIYEVLKDPLSMATATNNAGTILFFQGDYDGSLVLFNECLAIFDTNNIKSQLLNSVLSNIGEVYMEKGIWEESEIWLQKAIELAKELESPRNEWSVKTIYGKLLFKQGKYQESADLMKECYAVFLESDEKMGIAECATNLGKANRQLGNLEEAKKYFNEAIEVYRDIGSRKVIWEPLYELALVEKGMNNNLASIAYLKSAVDTLEGLSSDIGGSNAQKKLFAKANDKKNIYQSLISQLVESGEVKMAWTYQEKLNMYGLEEQTRGEPSRRGAADANTEEYELSELELKVDGIYSQLINEKAKPANQRSEEKINELEKRMSVASADYQNFFWDLVDSGVITNDFSNTINPEDLDQMRLDLDEDIIVLEYLVTDEQLIIFTASADTLGAKVIDISRESLEGFVNKYYNLLVYEEQEEPVIQASEQLYNVLIEPIKSLLVGKKKLAFIPTGILFKLPFQSLASTKNGKVEYIINDYEVFYLNDIRSTLNQIAMNVSDAKLIAFGNADSSLAFAEKEVDMISDKFPDAVVYVKSAAREDLAKSSMNDFQIVHFATHGNLDPINFNNSYLTMAPNLEAGEDGRLTMNEINRIRTLRSCQLIVLSACNTAVNDEKLEGWVNNPAKAFLRKGAKSAIASLWSVDDAATGLLMQHFYQNLKDGQSKSAALNNAQKALASSSEFSHPYYWAAFELMGQWK